MWRSRLPGDNRSVTALADDSTALLDEIRSLIDAPFGGERAPFLARIEHTLTDGYARALALEAERLRLERRIGEVAARLGDEDADDELGRKELSVLVRRLSSADGDLARLRSLLASLRERANAVRAA